MPQHVARRASLGQEIAPEQPLRKRLGFGYWSLSAYVKKRVKDAVSFIGEFEKAIVRYAEDYSVDAVLCA